MENQESSEGMKHLIKGCCDFIETFNAHGEEAAVAISEASFLEYILHEASQENSCNEMKKKRRIRSGLLNSDLSEFLPDDGKRSCSGKTPTCPRPEVTDQDVESVFNQMKVSGDSRKGSIRVKQDLEKISSGFLREEATSPQRSSKNPATSGWGNFRAAQESSDNNFFNSMQKPATSKPTSFQNPAIFRKGNDDRQFAPQKSVSSFSKQQSQAQPSFSSQKESEKLSLIETINRSLGGSRTVSKRDSSATNYTPPEHQSFTRQNQSPPRKIFSPNHQTIFQPSTKSSMTVPDQRRVALPENPKPNGFTTALQTYQANNDQMPRKSLGMTGRRLDPSNSFKPPLLQKKDDTAPSPQNDLFRGIDPELLEAIKGEIVDNTEGVGWDDIAGLDSVKQKIQEVVVLPLLRPDIFTGLRQSAKGILLFGPPGTGKTMIGKCIASAAKANFFSISASTLTSKWIGEGEKLVKAMFVYARAIQPSVIFIDEVDSILQKRNSSEHESSRRMKTEFLLQLDGAFKTAQTDKILIVAATNRPDEIDQAAIRRFSKRLYIPLPDAKGRRDLVQILLKDQNSNLSENDYQRIALWTEGYSGDDMKHLCRDASFQAVREIPVNTLQNMPLSQIRPLTLQDFKRSLESVKASNAPEDIKYFIDWNSKYGS